MPESRSNQALPIGSMVPGLQRGDIAVRPERWCACGTRLSRYNRGPRCSACELATPTPPTPAPQACEECGTPIYSTRPKRYCGHTCYERSRYHKVRVNKQPPRTTCQQCGEPIITPYPTRRFCSNKCRHRWNRGGAV